MHGALWHSAIPALPPALPPLDPDRIRARVRRHKTTRLVARTAPDGTASLRYEELDRGDPLAIPADRVAYRYALRDGALRLHLGTGLGYDRTAAAILEDLTAPRTGGGVS